MSATVGLPLRPIPTETEALTPEWLSAALRSGGVDVEVARFTATDFGEGAGMMSRLVRVELEYASGSGPPSVVVKLPSANPANHAVSIAYHLYEREVNFYQRAAPQTPARTVRTYYADIEGDSEFALIFEDLRGYHIGDQVTGCSVERARLCIPMMAALHASFWNKVDRPDFDFIPYHHPSFQSENLYQGAIAGWEPTMDLAGDLIPAPLRDWKERYLAAIPRMQEWITSDPRTIVHGDFRMDNLFFGQEPDHDPVAICDWQGTLRGKGAHDLAYFLSQSLLPDDRRREERDLVARWHAALCDGGVERYSAELAWEDYRRAVLYLWTYVVVIAGTLDPHNDRGRAWMREATRRSATAILDLGLVDLLSEFE